MSKFTQIPADTFKSIGLNAGTVLSNFDPETGKITPESIMGATTGDVTFTATPTYTDFGEDINGVKPNTAEMKRLESIAVKLSGTFTTITDKLAKDLVASGTISEITAKKITPRNYLTSEDFKDIWWVGDYSDVNDDGEGSGSSRKAGYIAIHIMKALNIDGFQLKATNGGKMTSPFNFQGHYSISEPDVVPYELYIMAGTEGT